eukprot:4952999-Pyramimonas_sp.AAC.1
MNAVIADVQKRLEADRIAQAQAASRREQELMEQMSYQTAAAQQRAEESDNRIVETLSSERQAALAANSLSADTKSACAAAAAARINVERAAITKAEHDRQELQDQLCAARLEVASAQIIAATVVDQNNPYREELESHEHARASLRRMQL